MTSKIILQEKVPVGVSEDYIVHSTSKKDYTCQYENCGKLIKRGQWHLHLTEREVEYQKLK